MSAADFSSPSVSTRCVNGSLIYLPSVYPLQSVPWRRPRATARSRQTTRLTAACTQTARAAPCRPSTAALTLAQNQNRTSCPTERSYAWSPARLSHAGAPSSSLDSPNRLFLPSVLAAPITPTCPASLQRSRRRAEDSVKEVLSCIKTLLPAFCLPPSKCHSAFLRLCCNAPLSPALQRDFLLFKMSRY